MQVESQKFETVSLRKYGKEGWRAQFPYKDEAGNWKKLTRTLKTTGRDRGRSTTIRDAARIEAEAMRCKLNDEYRIERERKELGFVRGETVSEYVAAYIDGRANHVERSTAAEYRRILSKLITPKLGAVELDALTPDAVQAWVNDLAREFAPVTVRKALVLLRSAMTQAVERDRLTKNPTRTVKGPKLDSPKPNALDERGRAKVAKFISIDPSSRTNLGFALAFYLGLREGEVCGLRWRSVDLERRVLGIDETIGHEGSRWYSKEPKTDGSRRTLPIPDALIEPLRVRRAQMNEARMATGMELKDLYVVGLEDGSFMQPHYLSRKWRITADALDLTGTQGKRPTFHDLRHTFATAAIAHGVDVKTVSSLMGHANAAMTMNTYASADPDAKKRGANAVAEAIAKEVRKHEGDGEVLEIGKTGTED